MPPNNIEVSIIIPCRNEEGFISKCLDSIICQDYPKDKIEVLVIDGRSEDRTREIVQRYIEKYPFVRLLDNPKKGRPAALNIGIREARGDFILRMDAHAAIEAKYITKCMEYLTSYNADIVGGRTITLPQRPTLLGKAIALALSHPFGVGTSYFRVGSKEPKWVDTVFCGYYKRKVFEKVGRFDERIELSEDINYHLRVKEAGFKILLVPEIVNYYWARSDLRSFYKHNFRNGMWAILPFKFSFKPVSFRHLIPLIFVLGLITTGILSIFSFTFLAIFLLMVSSYLSISLYSSIKIALRKKDLRYIFLMPLIFATLHIGYGVGSMVGFLKLVFF